MKKFMLVAAMVLGTVGMSYAQTTASTTAPITADVQVALSISETGTIAFGTVYTGTTPSVSAYSSSNVAEFTISGNPSTNVTINVDASDQLTGPSGSTPLTFTPNVVGWTSSTQPATGNAITSTGNPYTLGSAATGDNAGYFYLWVGGDISSIPTSQLSGSYSGTVTVQVQY